MIGLVDLQLQQWQKPSLCPPNLEIMKLASYYQREENKFCRIIGLDETELGGYDKVYVFSESKDFITVPEAFRRASNVIYGGTAFTNGIYIPFKEKLIDYQFARPNIYKEFLSMKYNEGIRAKEINKLLDNSYYRWHAGEEELPIPSIQKRHRIYIYDINFFQDGWQQVINKILARNPSSINFIHPAHYKKISDFLLVRENGLIAKSNDVFLDLNIPLKETNILMKHYKNRLQAVIVPNAQIYLPLGGSFQYQNEYYKDIIYKLNLLYVFWSCGLHLKMKYEEPSLGYYNSIADISKLIATWTQGETCYSKSIIDRIPKDKNLSEIRPEREQLEIILKKYPSKATLFRQTKETVKQGGFWRHGY